MEIAAKERLGYDEASPQAGRGYGNCSKGETCLARMRQASGLEAMETAIDAMESGAKQTLG